MPKMGTAKRKENMIAALKSTLGVIKTASEKCGVSRGTHDDWLRHDPKYREKVEAVYEEQIDFAESALFKQIRDGVPQSTIFFLKTKGKKRGYIEKIENETTVRVENSPAIDKIVENLGGLDAARKALGGAFGNG
jgi:hypothetical protein